MSVVRSVCRSVGLSVRLSVCQSVSLSVCLLVGLSVSPFVGRSEITSFFITSSVLFKPKSELICISAPAKQHATVQPCIRPCFPFRTNITIKEDDVFASQYWINFKIQWNYAFIHDCQNCVFCQHKKFERKYGGLNLFFGTFDLLFGRVSAFSSWILLDRIRSIWLWQQSHS